MRGVNGQPPPQQDDEANILARASAYINHREVGYSRDLTATIGEKRKYVIYVSRTPLHSCLLMK